MSIYFITGVTGYIGSMLAKHILAEQSDAEIIAPVRKLHTNAFLDSASALKRLTLIQTDLCDSVFPEKISAQTARIDYIIHCASVTKSAEMVSCPVESIRSIVNATQNVLELARHYEIKSMVYLSSMEVYGALDCPENRRITEGEAAQGVVEILDTRSCYPLGKRMAENLCCGYYKEYHVPVKIARLAQTFGRGILPTENRVFAQFARAVKDGTDIVLHTKGNSMGNYCAIDDAIEGILTILERGGNGEAYNVVNEENTTTILQMARLAAAQSAEGGTGIRFDIPPENSYGYAAGTGLRLSGKKLMQLGWKPKKNLADMYREMLEDMMNKA